MSNNYLYDRIELCFSYEHTCNCTGFINIQKRYFLKSFTNFNCKLVNDFLFFMILIHFFCNKLQLQKQIRYIYLHFHLLQESHGLICLNKV